MSSDLPHLKRVHIIGENDDLVPAFLVELDEKLARLELVGVHAVQKHALAGLLPQVLAIKLRGHRAPNFRAL